MKNQRQRLRDTALQLTQSRISVIPIGRICPIQSRRDRPEDFRERERARDRNSSAPNTKAKLMGRGRSFFCLARTALKAEIELNLITDPSPLFRARRQRLRPGDGSAKDVNR